MARAVLVPCQPLEFSLRLEPIVQGAPWLAATFEVDVVGTASNVLFRQGGPDGAPRIPSLGRAPLGPRIRRSR